MTLSDEQRRSFYAQGYLIVPGVVSLERIDRALRVINADLGRGIDPTRVTEFYSRSFCPSIRSADPIIELFEATRARSLADSLLAPGGSRPPKQAQIALRFPTTTAPVLPPPHIDGHHRPNNGVPSGKLAHFSMLVMVALSDVDADYAGNFTVWPGSHRQYERHFQSHGPTSMLADTPQLEALEAPVQLRVRRGDVLLAHYQLGHAAAPNLGSQIRYAVFFRLEHRDHDADDLSILSDIWREYPDLRAFAER